MNGWRMLARLSVVFCVTYLLAITVTQAQLNQMDVRLLKEEGVKKGWTFKVATNSATARSLSSLCGLHSPRAEKDKTAGRGVNTNLLAKTASLPASFDWRALNGCTPIKDQGYCGSCWAFGTVGPIECNIKIHDGVTVDLSEQWLVSCNQNGYNCDVGGQFSFGYFLSSGADTDPYGGSGAVLEQYFPYEASDVPCNGPYLHSYYINSWNYVGNWWSVASTESIKTAIMNYGPVASAVYVDSAFQAYSGGVFNHNVSSYPNHAIVLVGWDDSRGSAGAWILRNSWGTGWGESGYMWIEYGCSLVGYEAAYVDYQSSSPTNSTSDDGTILLFSIPHRRPR